MTEILLSAAKEPWESASAVDKLQAKSIADHAENLLFAQSLYRTCSAPETKITSDRDSSHHTKELAAFAKGINDSFDHIIIPLADACRVAIKPDLGRLKQEVRRLKASVTDYSTEPEARKLIGSWRRHGSRKLGLRK